MRLTIPVISLCLLMAGNVTAQPAPDWTLTSSDGEPVTLSEAVTEQPVVLFFWATWCPYCKALMPHMQSIQIEQGDAVKVLALHFRDDDGDPVAFMRNSGYDFTLLEDSEDVAKLYEVWGTPGVIIVDQDMQIRFNLYDLPKRNPPDTIEEPSHRIRAAYRAPYWAAEIRKALDVVLD